MSSMNGSHSTVYNSVNTGTDIIEFASCHDAFIFDVLKHNLRLQNIFCGKVIKMIESVADYDSKQIAVDNGPAGIRQ